MRTKKKERWFAPASSLNWSKSDSQTNRRKAALAARGGNTLAAARGLQALSNVNSSSKGDAETHRKALADAKYFYRLYAKKKK